MKPLIRANVPCSLTLCIYYDQRFLYLFPYLRMAIIPYLFPYADLLAQENFIRCHFIAIFL